MAATTEGAYAGAMSRMAAEPESVSRAIHRAITRRRARPRYVITLGARVMIAMRRLLPDRGWDAVMATQFKRPSP